MGFLYWLNTVLDVIYFGAVKVNPLLAGILDLNILVYSGIKLWTAILIGFMFYKVYTIEKTLGINSHLEQFFARTS